MHKFNKSNQREVKSLTEFQNDKEVETRRKTHREPRRKMASRGAGRIKHQEEEENEQN